MHTEEGTLLWKPSPQRVANANMTAYMQWLSESRGTQFDSYEQLWRWSVTEVRWSVTEVRWSVTEVEDFWRSIAEFFSLSPSPSDLNSVLANRSMPCGSWFPDLQTNVAGFVAAANVDDVALIAWSEKREEQSLTYGDLARRSGAASNGLRALGVGKDDRVVAIMPNIPESVEAFLATASIGAIWSCLRARIRHGGNHQPLRADRTKGSDRRRRLYLQRKGLRQSRRRPGSRRPATDARGGDHGAPPRPGLLVAEGCPMRAVE